MTGLRVYSAIAAITAELARTGVPKAQINSAEQYAYRGIDDVMTRLAPLLAKHRLCILPCVLERTASAQHSAKKGPLVSVTLKVAFDLVSARDGSSHTIEAYGEALDSGDKATSKAMSSAFKYAMIQTFCIPVHGSEDADASTYRLSHTTEQPDPDQGWDQWSLDIQDMIRICESDDALDRVQTTYRPQLHAASKRRADVYAAVGKAIRMRRDVLAGASAPPPPTTPAKPPVSTAAGAMADA